MLHTMLVLLKGDCDLWDQSLVEIFPGAREHCTYLMLTLRKYERLKIID